MLGYRFDKHGRFAHFSQAKQVNGFVIDGLIQIVFLSGSANARFNINVEDKFVAYDLLLLVKPVVGIKMNILECDDSHDCFVVRAAKLAGFTEFTGFTGFGGFTEFAEFGGMNTTEELLILPGYQIHIGHPWQALNALICEHAYSRVLVLVDSNTAIHCLPVLQQNLECKDIVVLQIPAGEQYKHIETCKEIWTQLMEAGADRHSLLLNLGGGVVGDMGGFCAATFKRGFHFVQLPTTLLSQVDASVGGKLGIDFGTLKNGIGVFQDPQGVFIDPVFLKTLPYNELRSGFAEMIKHSLIADVGQWEVLSKIMHLEEVDWRALLAPSLRIKQNIVEADPFEKGLRKALNFGHTVGHAVEGIALHTDAPLLHGEAIAVGMMIETILSQKLQGLVDGQTDAILHYIKQLYGPVPLDEDQFEAYLALMRQDKKNAGQAISMALIPEMGKVAVNCIVEETAIVAAMRAYNQFVRMII